MVITKIFRKSGFFSSIKLICLLCSLIFTKKIFAQKKLSFNNINVESGLSKSSVLSISQDKTGIMWIGTTSGLNKYDGNRFSIFKNVPSDSASVIGSDIEALLCDRAGNLWVGTSQGLDLYVPEKQVFRHFIRKKDITCLFQDRLGKIWVGSYNGLFQISRGNDHKWRITRMRIPSIDKLTVWCIYQESNETFWIGTNQGLFNLRYSNSMDVIKVYQNSKDDEKSVSDNNITAIIEDHKKNIWVGTKKNGLNLLNRVTGKFSRFFHSSTDKTSLVNNNIRKFIIDEENNLWIGTQDGLSIMDGRTHQFFSYQHDVLDANSLSQNSIYDLFLDTAGTIWIGTYFGGINKIDKFSTPFRKYQNDFLTGRLNSNVISAIVEDGNDNLWIGTEAKGLNFFNRKNGLFTAFKNDPLNLNSLSSNLVKSTIIDDKGMIWIGMSRGGLDMLNPATRKFVHYKFDPNNRFSISSDNVECLLIDTRNRFWIGTDKGINRFLPEQGIFENYANKKGAYNQLKGFIITLYEDHLQNLWASTSQGLFVMKKKAGSFVQLLGDNLNLRQVNCIKEDGSGLLWLGTENDGLISYDAERRIFKSYNVDSGLPSNNILAMAQDNFGNMWMSTDRGLSKFKIKEKLFVNYGVEDGLPGLEFNLGSALKSRNGELYFGGLKGMVSFNPSEIVENPISPNVIFTGLKLFNREVSIGGDDHLLSNSIGYTRKLIFKSEQNNFSIGFSSLNYIKPGKNRYAYRLDGFEKQWNYVSIPSATFTNLSSGKYTLLVKATNNDGIWSRKYKSIEITVLPPLWKTWWAFLLYSMLICVIVFYILRFFNARRKLKQDLYLEQIELAHKETLHQFKLNFFTNISHEIRTPLTLISGPIEELIKKSTDESTLHDSLLAIKKNSDKLNKLVTELMDFRKAEAGKVELKKNLIDMRNFINDIYVSFAPLAEHKSILFKFSGFDETLIFVDVYQMEKVFFNILSNAFKFTPPDGTILIVLERVEEKDEVEIKILDTGQGIPEDSLDLIFNEFYQVGSPGSNKSGTGLGLAVARQIVELHGGTLKVSGNEKIGDMLFVTCFTITLPAHHEAYRHEGYEVMAHENFMVNNAPDVSEIYSDIPRASEQNQSAHPTILLVEDNAEVRDFIYQTLKNSYNIDLAVDGLDGWEKAIKSIPDLIISDVMMPKMDGKELCKKIKTDPRTCHIPVILLTALSDFGEKVTGLEMGADAYITKPFSTKLLELQVGNMLSLQQAVQNRHIKNILLAPKNTNSDSVDDRLLSRIISVIDNNLGNSEFSLSDLTREIGMSKTVLYKKFSALTTLSLTDFIKNQRLRYACSLLKEDNLSLLEVSEKSGFNDVKYFSKEFKKRFGISPSQYIKGHNLHA